jgi:serine/threonine-protein kinase
LKVLTSPLAHDSAFRERFVRESQIAAGLDHPNIVPVYDAGEADGILYLAMRYIKGSDLGHTVRSEGPLDPWRVIALIADVASALDAAHAEGLVHRDVKPGNILLTRDRVTGIERAFLADFGLTKRLASSGGGLTRSGQFVGTVDYVAPEQILGEPVDGRADGYSLACVLFLTLTGRPPFPRPNDVGTIYAHVHEPPPHLTANGNTKLDRVIARGLAKDRNDRYGTCSSLVEAARSALQAEPETLAGISAIKADPVPERISPTEDHPTVVVDREPTKEASPPGTARPRHARPKARVRVVGAAVVLLVVVAAAILLSINRGEDPRDPSGSTPSGTGPGNSGFEALEYTWQNIGPFQSDLSHVDEQEVVIAAVSAPGGGLLGVGHADPSAVDEDPAVWSSPNGFDWTRVDAEALRAPGSQRIVDIVAFGNAYIAVGTSGGDAAVWASDTEAVGWHLVDTIEESGWQVMREIVESDGSLQVVGWQELNGDVDAATWRSEDGIAWERVPDPELEGPGKQELWTALAVDGTVIGLGAASEGSGSKDAAVWRLGLDGWTRLDVDLAAPGEQEIRDVALAPDGTIVAVGISGEDSASDARIWTSDASRLSEWEVASGRFPTPLAQELLAVVATDQGFVAMGWTTREGSRRDGWIWTSPDGRRWIEVQDRGTVVVFGGPQTQEVRSLISFGSEDDPQLAALGTSGTANEDAEIWIGTPRR